MASLLFPALVVGTYAVAIAIAWHLSDGHRWRQRLTDRFLYGVPWGTLVVIGFVLSVYCFLQGGFWHWYDPVVIPFRAWSYLYPLGILTAAFSHASAGHVVGNLIGTVVLAPLAEYAWSHYPDRDGWRSTAAATDGGTRSHVTTEETRFERLLRTPWVRALVVFPGVVLLVGLFTAAFSLGPVIGFSGVVFAFGGFALVRYPISTLVGLLVSSVLSTTYYSLIDPIVRAGTSGSAPSPPGWATVAVQGHAIGVLIGVVLGLALLQYRGVRPNAGRVLLAMVVYGMTEGLWAIYWFEGNGVYVLARGLGVAAVLVLAVLVAVAATAEDRPLSESLARLPRSPTPRQCAALWLGALGVVVAGSSIAAAVLSVPLVTTLLVAGSVALVLAIPAIAVLSPITLDESPSGRQAAFGILLITLTVLAAPAMYPNLATVGDDPVPGDDGVTVQGYSIIYAEDVRNRMIPAIDVPTLANETTVPTSGVIVVNEDRHIWTTAVSKQYLASEGAASVQLGGVGWRDTVYAYRTGWSVTGNESAYAVDLKDDGETVRSFTGDPRRATPVLANHTIAVVPDDDRFQLRVYQNEDRIGTEPIPALGNRTTIGPISLSTREYRDRVTVFASIDATRVRIAQRERYRNG